MESHKYIGLYKYKVSLKITMNYEIFRMVDLWDSYSELGGLHFHNIPMLCLIIQNYVDGWRIAFTDDWLGLQRQITG